MNAQTFFNICVLIYIFIQLAINAKVLNIITRIIDYLGAIS